MEGPIPGNSFTSTNGNLNGNPFKFFIKKENSDASIQSDKVLQFTLALQRHKIKEVIHVNNEEEPLVMDPPIRTVDCVDLTLSSDDEDCSPTQPTLGRNGFNQEPDEGSNDTIVREDPPPVTIEIDTDEPYLVHSTVDEDEMDYAAAMSSLEVQLEEAEGDGMNDFGLGYDDSRLPRKSLPYTDEEKRTALRGNPNFDYRTKLNENGEEIYAIFKCPKCPTGFPRMHHYLVHVRSHGRTVGNYRCPECDLTTANSAFLANHLERHRLQREPQIFTNLQGRSRKASVSVEKRPLPESPTRSASILKKPNNGTSPSGEASITMYKEAAIAGNSLSGEIATARPSLVQSFTSSSIVEKGTDAERIEARKGNPNIVYRNLGRRSHPNGRTYERTSYKCQECPYTNEKYELYLAHTDGHKVQRPFACNQCSYSTSTQGYLDRHVALHKDQPTNFNTLDTIPNGTHFMTTTPTRLTSNEMAEYVQPVQPYRSTNSGRGRRGRGAGRGGRRRSRSSGGGVGAMQCPKCPSKLSGSLNLRIHIKQHGKLGMKLTCPYCDYGSNRDDYMRNHIEAHLNSEDSYPDPNPMDAGRGNVSSPILSASAVQSDSPVTASAANGRPENLTEEDYAKLINGNPRIDYMTISTNGQLLPLGSSYKCWNCPYATIKYALLVAHQQRHEAKAKYACNKCSYSANTIQGLKNHELAHTVQHEAAHKASNGQPISFHGETPQTQRPGSAASSASSGPPPPPAPSDSFIGRPESGQFFITNIRILNIMAMSAEPTVADVSAHGILKLKGNSEEGKSSYILAVMLGLGYDLCLDHRDEFTSICGLTLKNAISDGKDFASVELTVSLRAYPELQKEFGSQIKFSRRITRVPSDLSNMLVITSADPRPQYNMTRPKVVGGKDLVSFLRKLKLSPERLRLMLLDGENVKYMMDNSQIWYELFEAGVYESSIDIEQKTTETKFLLQRLQGREKLQRERLQWFQSRLGMRPPMDTEKIRQVSEEDWTNHRKCTMEMNQLAAERQDLEQKLINYAEQERDGTPGYILRMRTVFDKFLDQLNYSGEIIICEDTQRLAICIWKTETKEIRPTTIDAVTAMWKTLSVGKRRIAVIGLYMALWEISSYLGVLAVDAFSCTEADFHVPPSCLPIVWELLNRKCFEQKQCIISLPPDY